MDFSQYLAIPKGKRKKIHEIFLNIIILIKVDKGKGGGGWQRWLKKCPNVNIIEFTKVDKGEGGKKAYLPKVDNLPYFLNPSLTS